MTGPPDRLVTFDAETDAEIGSGTGTGDELHVGRAPRRPPPWNGWSPRRRGLIAAVAAVVVVAAVVALLVVRPGVGRPSAVSAASSTASLVTGAPGADVVVTVPPQTRRCPGGHNCLYSAQVTPGFEQAFRTAFASAGYISRQRVSDATTGEVFWQVIAFSTGTLVTITLTQQTFSAAERPAPTEVSTPSSRDLAGGSINLTAVRDGYVSTVTAAGLPGQTMPVRATQAWLAAVPNPG